VTPVYKSPDRDEAEAILELLLEHNIMASIIKTNGTGNTAYNHRISWYELWLRKQTDVRHAETIITQFEFINYKNNLADATLTENHQNISADKTNPVYAEPPPAVTATQPREKKSLPPVTVTTRLNHQVSLTPINNKRVFRRLGLLLGFSEKEIEELDNNKLYRPWDSDRLMEQVNNLKRKCR